MKLIYLHKSQRRTIRTIFIPLLFICRRCSLQRTSTSARLAATGAPSSAIHRQCILLRTSSFFRVRCRSTKAGHPLNQSGSRGGFLHIANISRCERIAAHRDCGRYIGSGDSLRLEASRDFKPTCRSGATLQRGHSLRRLQRSQAASLPRTAATSSRSGGHEGSRLGCRFTVEGLHSKATLISS